MRRGAPAQYGCRKVQRQQPYSSYTRFQGPECQKSVESQQAKSQPVIGHYIPATTVTLLGTSFTQISILESLQPDASQCAFAIGNGSLPTNPWILGCASLLGWGAVLEGVQTGGLWSEGEQMHHINLLEFTAGNSQSKPLLGTGKTLICSSKWTTRQPYFISTRWGNSITSPCPHSWPAVAVVPPAGDHIISRTSAWVQQHHRGLRASASSLVSGVDAQQGDIHLGNGGPGPMSTGSVCNSTQPPAELVFELEARLVRNGDRCFLHQLERRKICLPIGWNLLNGYVSPFSWERAADC